MLKTHMDANEAALLATSQVPASSGHSLHKGTPRETFIRSFLASHLAESVAIGTGEIIDANSKPGASRNQFDIVIYNRSYPKLDFGGGISGFLIESVIATIEVKSVLDKAGIDQAIGAAVNAKSLTPSVMTSFYTGHIPPKVLNFVVAYDGPAHMSTVWDWINQIHISKGIADPILPPAYPQRGSQPSPSVDGVFVLGKGFVYFDNTPFSYINDADRAANPQLRWVFADGASGNLLLFFLLLQYATANVSARFLDAVPYLRSAQMGVIHAGPNA